MIGFDMLFDGWEAEGYKPEIMKKVYYQNAIRILNLDIGEEEFK
jgi:hypothetical protein